MAKIWSEMLFLSLLIFFFASALFFWKRKTRLGALSFVFAAILCLGVGQGWVTRFLLATLQTRAPLLNPQWQERNAIILLGGGSVHWKGLDHLSSPSFAYSRIFEAARLHRNCQSSQKTCVVVVSGGDPRGNGVSEAQLMQRELVQIGVPVEAILLEEQSRNTFQNAKFTSTLLKSQNFSKQVLVTSGFHLSRALRFFSFFKMEVEGAPSDQMEAFMSLVPLSQNFLYADIVVREYLAFVQFAFYNLMGWNAAD